MVEITLAHPLSERDVTLLGLPPGDYAVGDTITTDTETALRLIQAGFTTINPFDTDAVAGIRAGSIASFVTGRWYVNLSRQVVSLATIRAANRIPADDVYRIERRRDGVILTFLWARAGVQIPNDVLTAAEQSVTAPPVPLEPSPNSLGGTGGGGDSIGYVDPANPSVLVIATSATAVIDPANPNVLVLTV